MIFFTFRVVALLIFSIVPLWSPASDQSPTRISRSLVQKVSTVLGEFNVEVHFQNGQEALVERVSEILEQDGPRLVEYFGWLPDEIVHITVNPPVYQANGAATVFPTNLIWLNHWPPAAPSYLADTGDWLRLLVVHELAHVLHMDQTRGVLAWIRQLFGSVGKLGGVVPRWFIEGLAIWAESHLTQGPGRLGSTRLWRDVLYGMSSPLICDSVDCLDSPGYYPHGNFPYWVGAHLLDYLEQARPYTLQCLVHENSRSVFRISRKFEVCTGKTLEVVYQEFRLYARERMQEHQRRTQELAVKLAAQSVTMDLAGDEAVVYQTGLALKESKLFYATEKRGVRTLRSIELGDPSNKASYRPPGMVDSIMPGPGPLTISTGTNHPTMENAWWVLQAQQFRAPQVDEHWPAVEYFFAPHEQASWRFLYRDSHWQAVHAASAASKHFSHHESLGMPLLAQTGDVAYLALFDAASGQWQIRSMGGPSGERIIWQTPVPLVALTSCGPGALYMYDKNLLYVDQAGSVLASSGDWSEITELLFDGDHGVFFSVGAPQKAHYLPYSCQQFVRQWVNLPVQGAGASEPEDHKEDYKDEDREEKAHIFEETSYPSLHHFRPYYWFVSYLNNGNLSVLSANTTLSDPANRHNLSLGLDHYPAIDKTGGLAQYTYRGDEWAMNGDWIFSASYRRVYGLSSIGQTPNKIESTRWSFGHSFNHRAWRYVPTLYTSVATEDDFLGRRDTRLAGTDHQLTYVPLERDDFWQGASLRFQFFHQDVRVGKDHLGFNSRVNWRLRPHREFDILTKASYGRLLKPGLRDGTIFGGWQGLGGDEGMHDFYGVAWPDMFGNTVLTARVQGDWTLRRPHRGSGTFPWFTKELHLVAGAEMARADRIAVGHQFLRHREVAAYHVGARVLADVFYLLPIEADLLFVTIPERFGGGDTRGLLLIRGRFAP